MIAQGLTQVAEVAADGREVGMRLEPEIGRERDGAERVVELRMREPDQDRPLIGILGIQQAQLPILLDGALARPVIQWREREADALFT